MMVTVIIQHKHAAQQDIMLQEFIVLNVMLLNIGMPLLKDVLVVNLGTLGMMLFTNVHAANYQDKLLELIVYAHHQKLNGTIPLKPAHVHQTPMVNNVNHAQHQDNGTIKLTLVNAHHQQLNGTEPNVFAQLQLMDQAVSHVQPQDSGMVTPVFALKREYGTDNNVFVKPDYLVQTVLNAHLNNSGMIKLKLVFVHHHSFITVNTVFVLNHISLIMVNVANVLMDSNGKKIDVHNADAAPLPLSIGKMPTNNQLSILEQTLLLPK